MTARLFAITRSPESGVVLAFALLCPEARYASVRWTREPRLERRHGAAWPAVTADLEIGWPKGIVAPGSATARALLRDDVAGYHLQAVTEHQVPLTDPANVAKFLDVLLWNQPLD